MTMDDLGVTPISGNLHWWMEFWERLISDKTSSFDIMCMFEQHIEQHVCCRSIPDLANFYVRYPQVCCYSTTILYNVFFLHSEHWMGTLGGKNLIFDASKTMVWGNIQISGNYGRNYIHPTYLRKLWRKAKVTMVPCSFVFFNQWTRPQRGFPLLTPRPPVPKPWDISQELDGMGKSD